VPALDLENSLPSIFALSTRLEWLEAKHQLPEVGGSGRSGGETQRSLTTSEQRQRPLGGKREENSGIYSYICKSWPILPRPYQCVERGREQTQSGATLHFILFGSSSSPYFPCQTIHINTICLPIQNTNTTNRNNRSNQSKTMGRPNDKM